MKRCRVFIAASIAVASVSLEAPADEPTDEEPLVIEVRGASPSIRGIGDTRVTRSQLEASPRQHTTELLSAAPGFFVDHEYGEGLGNDVYLRGFDLEHGSGIEMRVAGVPVNNPTHVQGQGYADVNFVIPEVVRSIRVLEGPYDPRQGDAAIVGSAYFDLGVPERGYRLATSYGSYGHARVVGIAAPKALPQDSFAAVALRRTDGFGEHRAAESGSFNAQYRLDLGGSDDVRFVAAAHAARSDLAGVVREDDVEAGRIGYYDRYPFLADNQSARSRRVLFGARFEHITDESGKLTITPWAMWSDFRARQNFAGALETSQIDPLLSGRGDLFENANTERAFGIYGGYRGAPVELGESVELVTEPGVYLRAGHTEQSKKLLVPRTLETWDRRVDTGIDTVDLGAYFDVDLRLLRKLRFSGGPRVDVLAMSIDDRLASVLPASPEGTLAQHRNALGVSVGPRLTAEYAASRALSVALSYGEGFRSLDAARLEDGASRPFSKVRSVETGVRGSDKRRRFQTTLAVFNTWVGNELVFVAESGGFETQGASIRRGVVGSFLARPARWLLWSSALSVTDAEFRTRVPGISHRVPSVPPILFRTDATARSTLGRIEETPLMGRVGVGYSFLSGKPLSNFATGPATHAVNATAGVRYGAISLDLDAYNVLGLQYADTANVYVSNWSLSPGQQPASFATHLSAAAPRTLIATATVDF